MSSFTNYLDIRKIGKRRWELLTPFSYHVGSEDSVEVINVPKEFVSDGASIPRIFWSIIGHPFGEYAQAAFLHDYLYVTQQYSRKEADRIFLEAMKVLKVSWWRRRTMWLAVRMFAGRPWNKYKKKLMEGKNE